MKVFLISVIEIKKNTKIPLIYINLFKTKKDQTEGLRKEISNLTKYGKITLTTTIKIIIDTFDKQKKYIIKLSEDTL